MTTISAGTTSTTAYVATPDTTGTLVLKTGSSNATALTLDASQNATLAGTLTVPGAISASGGVVGAVTGNASTATALTTASGSAPSYSARAWVNFNGTGTVAIRASGNVSSITDNGVGDYTINFTTAMVDANYAPTFSGIPVSSPSDTRAVTTTIYGAYNTGPTTMSTTALRIQTSGTSITQPLDVNTICASIFR